MTDIHSHILPGVDDGSPSWEVTDRMLAAYVAEGVDTVVCTPHQGAGSFRPELIKERFAMLEERAKDLPLALRHAEHVHARGEEQAHHHGHRQRHQRVPDLARLGAHL